MSVGARPIRFSLPAGLATAVGALPQVSPPEWSRVAHDVMPDLPAAHTVNLDSGNDAARSLRSSSSSRRWPGGPIRWS